ncbi:DUF3179 domain-containing (seleno)protein [Fulvivirgaceae bacterium BMA10]|uniref:DUF3179 domain-containing (Seleno)protein n=1 Tax=Splendidivirga corallicola TaxID=3051826 RepID=A0ABT8KUQ8_9BACT|nr:DUF3179 domain-containing (seleno)protein [Fulvivirgaceae bacterium BMA10]
MKSKFSLLFLILLLLTWACNNSTESQSGKEVAAADAANEEKPKKRPVSVENGKFFEKEGRKYLYGGEREDQHFDITGYTLKDEQFHYGIGREKFPALLEPNFISVEIADSIFSDEDRFLLLKIGEDARAYSIKDLEHHEVVNDMVNGKPVMAAYCILADLGAIYDRTLGDKVFTFALSGYTYYDEEVWDGLDGFVMWDRETESLWWPLIGKAVSGAMQGTDMKVLDEQLWSQTTWGIIKEKNPQAMVLEPGQDFERPATWAKYEDIQPISSEGKGIAPRWGENADEESDD